MHVSLRESRGGSRIQTWNRYAYVANNPLNATDPLGLYKGVCGDGPRNAGCLWGSYTDAGAIGTWGPGSFAEGVTAIAIFTQQDEAGFPGDMVQVPVYGFMGLQAIFGYNFAATWTALKKAVENAKQTIANSSTCTNFYGGNGIQTIDSTTYHIGPDISTDLSSGVAMYTEAGSNPPEVFVNPDVGGGFLAPPSEFYGVTGASNIQSYFVLHEAAHSLSSFTGFYPNDYSKNPDGTPYAQGQINQWVNNVRLTGYCPK